jgi:homoserine O-acetyltransferase
LSLKLETKTEHFTSALYLESGRILEPYDITYETYGTLNDEKNNAILVCHALTGSHHCAGVYEGEKKAGWWDALIGSAKAIDTDRYFVICTNVIGSCFGSTGPLSPKLPSIEPYRYKFPVITIKDMIKAQRVLLDRLGIHSLEMIIGGSMGGMQALMFATTYPNFAKKVIALATTHATQPWAIAFNKISQEAILRDPLFKDGYYDPDEIHSSGLAGMAVGRMAGHISFLSPSSMGRKFGREYRSTDGMFELFGKYQVETYLEYNGYNFTKWFDPLSYIYIMKAINIYDLSYGYDSLEDALSRIKTQLHLISFRDDILFLPSEMEHIASTLESIGNTNFSYTEIASDYGHDAFLVEVEKFDFMIKKILEG